VTAVATGDKAAKMASASAAAPAVYEGAHPTAAWYAAMAGEAGGSGGALAGAPGASGAAAPRRADAKRAAPGEEPAGGKQRGAASGGEMFGLTHKRVAAALQRLPDAPRCDKYQARAVQQRSGSVRARREVAEAQMSLRVASQCCAAAAARVCALRSAAALRCADAHGGGGAGCSVRACAAHCTERIAKLDGSLKH
jgi:hypothetical protein